MLQETRTWAVDRIFRFWGCHVHAMHGLATKLALTDVWLAHEHDEANFDWAAQAEVIKSHDTERFNELWGQFEKCQDVLSVFCTHAKISESTIAEFAELAGKVDLIRLAVMSCAFIEIIAEPLQEGESVAGNIRSTRSGLSSIGLVVPPYMSKVVRHRQTLSP